MRLCERGNWTKRCGPICMEMCVDWLSEECRFSKSKRGWFCEQCWVHSIPDSEVDNDYACPVCGADAFLFEPDERFDVAAWCGGNGRPWTPELGGNDADKP